MKKGLVMKGCSGSAVLEQAVNKLVYMDYKPSDSNCQKQVDVKGFTGKGGNCSLSALREAIDMRDCVERDMRNLAAGSKQVKGLGFYLVVHQRASSGYLFLRWRQRFGRNRHLSWDEADALVRDLPCDYSQWVHDVAKQAQELNAKHLSARKRVAELRRAVDDKPPHLFPRIVNTV